MPDTAAEPTRWTRGRTIAVVAVLAMVAMWGYVLYLAIGPGRQDPPDRLDDPAFATAAEARCSAALEVIAALPAASETPTAAERADVVDRANAALDDMLDDLATLVPAGEDGEIVTEWLADWRVYLGDREDYAERLHTDADARMLVSPKDQEQITEYIDGFAADNRMAACATPIDV